MSLQQVRESLESILSHVERMKKAGKSPNGATVARIARTALMQTERDPGRPFKAVGDDPSVNAWPSRPRKGAKPAADLPVHVVGPAL